MKYNILASLVISLCLSGQATAERLDVHSIVPQLKHAEYKVVDHSSLVRRTTPDVTALEITKKFNFFDGQDYVIKNSYTSANGVTHTYLKQVINGKEVANGNININVDKNGNVISYGNSFIPVSLKGSINFTKINLGNIVTAVETFFNHVKLDLGIKKENIVFFKLRSGEDDIKIIIVPIYKRGIAASQTYVQNGYQSVILSWNIRIKLEDNWLSVYVDTNSDKVIAIYLWVNEASYNAYALPINNSLNDKRTTVTEEGSKLASPLGWHDQGDNITFTSTTCNKVIALENRKYDSYWENNPRPDGGKDLLFDFLLDLTKQPGEYINTAVTNLFYISNWYHDFLYFQGFKEEAGNFQMNNFGKGGLGGDPVRAQAQNGAGKNNTNFASPLDGSQSVIRMYTWNKANLNRDGDFVNTMFIHQYTHGLSNRLTGGPNDSNFLQVRESRGMGEGWSDMFANILRYQEHWNRTQELVMGVHGSF